MTDREKVIENLEKAKTIIEKWVPMFEQYNTPAGIDDAITLLKEQERTVSGIQKEREDKVIEIIAEWLVKRYEPPKPVNFWFTSEKAIENACKKMWVAQLNELIKKEC